jgi:maltoporin
VTLRRVRIGSLAAVLLSAQAFAQDPKDADAEAGTSAPQEKQSGPPPVPEAAEAAPPIAPPAPAVAPPPKPKFGDVSMSGYFRGSFGAIFPQGIVGSAPGTPTERIGGRMTCFALALPNGMLSKYRLGNECEVWSEAHFKMVTYVGDSGTVGTLHFMPTVFIPTTFIGYTPTGVINSPLRATSSTGATLSFPTLYADIKGIPWLHGGTAWAGTRYYKRESVYISDFFYWNPSGVGAGIEDVNLPGGLRLSYAAFAVDGRLVPGDVPGAPELPRQVDFGVRNDVQLRGISFYEGGEFQLGFQYIVDMSNNYDANGRKLTHGGWGVTVRHVQQILGGDNKLVFQYGMGAGTGFGTLARFYYPDFSLYNVPNEYRMRVVDVLTVQPLPWLGAQLNFVFQRDDLRNPGSITDWYSAGGRLSFAFVEHAKLLGEAGYDRIIKNNGAPPQYVAKFTGAVALTTGREFLTRPELRLFWTWAVWNDAARIAHIDSGQVYSNTLYLAGSTFGVQAETWW